MARNTVDFDDLLASLDDLTSSTSVPLQSETHAHHSSKDDDFDFDFDFKPKKEDHHSNKSSSSSSSSDDEGKRGSVQQDVQLSFHHDDHHSHDSDSDHESRHEVHKRDDSDDERRSINLDIHLGSHDSHHHHDDDDHSVSLSFSAPPPPPAAPPAPAPPPPGPPSGGLKKAVAKPTPLKATVKPAPAVAKPKAVAQVKPAQLKATLLKPVAKPEIVSGSDSKPPLKPSVVDTKPLRSASQRNNDLSTPSHAQSHSHTQSYNQPSYGSQSQSHNQPSYNQSHSQSSYAQPQHGGHGHGHAQQGYAQQGHSQPKQPLNTSGDMRNFARQSQILRPSHAGSSSDRCDKCGDKFDGEYVNAIGKSFHLHHFTCNTCSRQLGSTFYEHKGHALCENCAGSLLPCTKCGRGITGQYIIQDGKPHHKECIDRWVCARCHRDVEDVVTNALNKHWHKHCFTCHSCNTPLGGQFIARDGEPVCQNCANKALPKCVHCHRELIGDYTNYDGKAYHNVCFKCQRCGSQLQLSGFFNVGGQAVCERCANK